MATVTPVALVVFNRPDHTAATFARIRQQQPRELFIVADGPRSDHPSDPARCAEVRALLEEVDWPCDVRRSYADENLGLRRRVSTGLDWVFAQVDRAIILEDDCVAEPDFFGFCDAMLDRYADDSRVMAVTGDNFQRGRRRGEAAYYFSKYPHVWGWATWRRAWERYEPDIPFWSLWKKSTEWRQAMPDLWERRYWERIFDRVASGQSNSWAYPWTAALWRHGGLTATPNANLVENIGFGEGATNTTVTQTGVGVTHLGPITHPTEVHADVAADRFVFRNHFGGGFRLIPKRVVAKARRLRAGGP